MTSRLPAYVRSCDKPNALCLLVNKVMLLAGEGRQRARVQGSPSPNLGFCLSVSVGQSIATQIGTGVFLPMRGVRWLACGPDRGFPDVGLGEWCGVMPGGTARGSRVGEKRRKTAGSRSLA